ncbi:MFS transporter [Amycolatopsis sp. YIM 10]|uniref:MFS transporter n=1 Tax=Amycolatopsis sp. YIM 10 TaxID=2653857 RepID=UPI0012905067|nr:MFS transporter [Amycolatopsis sp. YIM 10]QFU92763.1 Multidrug resistance protein 3 [Amycolatopsis sp. YIM 10]
MHAFKSSRSFAFAGVLLGMLLAQLDLTVVVTALPLIGGELDAGPAVAGITAASLLTATVSTPIHGRFGDLYGRKAAFVLALGLLTVGSAWCALAGDIGWLVAGRAVQGAGAGGLIVGAMAALGELFDRTELIRRQGWQVAVGAVASLAGPPAGGLVADVFGWRWLFWFNLPLAAVALVLGLAGLPGRRAERPAGGLDLRGSALLVVAGTAATALGTVPELARSPLWTPVLAAVAVAAGFAFARTQTLIPRRIFADPVVVRSVLATTLAGIALYGTFTYISLVIALGVRGDPGAAGLLLLAMTGGSLLVSSCFAVLARRWPRMTAWGRWGCVTGAAGLALLAVSAHTGGVALMAVGLVLTGGSFMLVVSAYTVLAQGRAAPAEMGATMGVFTFARQAGGVAGTTLLGWLALLVTGGFEAAGLTVVFAAAALAMVAALTCSPRVVTTGEVVSSPS